MSSTSITFLKSSLGKMGGAEKYTLRLGGYFANKGHPVRILTTGMVPLSAYPKGLVVHSLCSRPIFSVRHLHVFDTACTKVLHQTGAPVIFGMDRNRHQTHLRASNGVHRAYLKARQLSDPLYKRAFFCVNPLHRLLLAIEKESFESPLLQLLFVNSHMVRQEVLEYYRVCPTKIRVVHNGVEWSEMEEDFLNWTQKKAAYLQKHPTQQSGFHIAFVGNDFRRKGLEPLLHAIALCSKKLDIHCLVAGKNKQAPFFQLLCHKLKIADRVTFLGQPSDMRVVYQIADCIAIPSHYDPFANVTVEALAMGVFVISSRRNGACEILSPATGMILEDHLDPECIATALLQASKNQKTKKTASDIRQSTAHLDFSQVLPRIYDAIFP